MAYPVQRPRRLRRTEALRALVRETHLNPAAMIYPVFVESGAGIRREIPSMPGQFNMSVDEVIETARAVERSGVGGMLFFGIPESKDELGTGAYDPEGVVQEAIRAVRQNTSKLLLVTDVCLCEYTSHGHCGVVRHRDVDNDPSLELIAATAVSHAQAGADLVAPSDMMDGRVGAIRSALDGAGFAHIPVMSYAAKYASAFYGPFREAAGSTPQFGDRRTYQMDPSNRREALREMRLDLEEGADILMVKPALPCLDVLADARSEFDVPLAAYQVSGEYAMIEAAAARGWLDRERTIMETLTAIRRAGADIIISYYAAEVAGRL